MGICARHSHFNIGRRSLNTGILTSLLRGRRVSFAIQLNTAAHEVGHSLGAAHDTGRCRENGNLFLMNPIILESQVKRFSRCSKADIYEVLRRATCLKREAIPEECNCDIFNSEGEPLLPLYPREPSEAFDRSSTPLPYNITLPECVGNETSCEDPYCLLQTANNFTISQESGIAR
ncbi:disintegrin and metalloproteinase domain-containing protein 10-like [Zophobas morio]|uniref:disintegrin and metalloproteinase domain-containing protein 10-like n=1 Tax=Zophobas morio TaxID=2755281 RepID=UPI0030839CA9